MFQQRHYIRIAALLASQRDEMPPRFWRGIVDRFVTSFANDSAKFKPALFLRACGVDHA